LQKVIYHNMEPNRFKLATIRNITINLHLFEKSETSYLLL